MLRWIFAPENRDHRVALYQAHLEELPANRFATLYAELCRLEEWEQSPWLRLFVSAWAKKDPEGAWKTVHGWFDMTMVGDHFVDAWQQELRPPRRRDLVRSGAVLPDGQLLMAFLDGLRLSTLPPKKREAMEAEFERALTEIFGEDQQSANLYESKETVDLRAVRAVQAASMPGLLDLLDRAVAEKQVFTVKCGLRRWLALMPEAGEHVINWARTRMPETVGAALGAWAVSHPEEAYAWVLKNQADGLHEGAGRALVPHLNQAQREDLLQRIAGIDGPEVNMHYNLADALSLWALREPEKAFAKALAMGGRETLSWCAFTTICQMGPLEESRNPVLEAIASLPVSVDENRAYMIMEDWGDTNSAQAARYGVAWLLKEREFNKDSIYTKEYLIHVWSGKDGPGDADMDDRTFGCLRVWAIVAPDEMAAWIKTLPDPEIQAALEWLRLHAQGGFEPGTRD